MVASLVRIEYGSDFSAVNSCFRNFSGTEQLAHTLVRVLPLFTHLGEIWRMPAVFPVPDQPDHGSTEPVAHALSAATMPGPGSLPPGFKPVKGYRPPVVSQWLRAVCGNIRASANKRTGHQQAKRIGSQMSSFPWGAFSRPAEPSNPIVCRVHIKADAGSPPAAIPFRLHEEPDRIIFQAMTLIIKAALRRLRTPKRSDWGKARCP